MKQFIILLLLFAPYYVFAIPSKFSVNSEEGISIIYTTKSSGVKCDEGKCYKCYYLSVGDGTNSAISTSSVGHITIPNKFEYQGETCIVNYIGNSAFSGCTGLTSITIPESVTNIGNSAFQDCTGLTSITIPESVTNIGNYVFRRCTGLTSITIPESVTNIGNYVFDDCTGLTSITIPKSVTNTGVAAFSGCTGLTSITIPESVTNIGNYAFSGCTGLTSITIPESVTNIGNYAFSGCTGLTSITIPESVTNIGSHAFSGCTGLTSITIPESVTNIGHYAFQDCTGLTSITIPESVTNIGDYAFSGCTGLTSITIPESVTNIGNSAFEDCTGLTSIKLPSTITSIRDRAFYGCNNLNALLFHPNSTLSIIGKECCRNLDNLTTVVFPAHIEEISEYAFYDCDNLTTIENFHSISNIGTFAFCSCENLKSPIKLKHVKTIGSYAFQDCAIPSLVIPETIMEFGYRAFQSDGLKEVTIKRRIPLDISVSDKVFGYVDVLYVPYGTYSEYFNIYRWDFKNIKYLTPDIGDSFPMSIPLDNDSIVFDVTISSSSEAEISKLTYIPEITELVLPCSGRGYDKKEYVFTKIGAGAFKDYSSLKTITIPLSVVSIGDEAFSGCITLDTIAIPQNVTKIGKAFDSCANLRSVKVEWRYPSEIEIDSTNFKDLNDSAVLYVPIGTYERYAEHNVWKKFHTIIEYGSIYASDIKSKYGCYSYLPIYLKNDTNIAGIQFRLTLPEGVSMLEEDGVLVCETTERTKDMTIMGRKDPDFENSYLFVLLSLSGDIIKRGTGDIMNIKIKLDNDIKVGSYDIKMDEIYLCTSLLETQIPENISSVLKVTDIIQGDVNNDDVVNVTDAIGIVNHILQQTPSVFIEGAADVNGDGVINITDAIGVINKILQVESASKYHTLQIDSIKEAQ